MRIPEPRTGVLPFKRRTPRAQLARSLYSATMEIAGAQPIQQVERNFSCTRPHHEVQHRGPVPVLLRHVWQLPGRQRRRGRHHRARGISRVLSPPKRGRTISLGPASPPASSDLPGTRTGRATPRPLFGLAPGGACRATSVTGRPVRSYRTVSPLPEPPRGGHRRSALCCAFRRRHQTAPGCYPAPCPVELGLSSGSLAT